MTPSGLKENDILVATRDITWGSGRELRSLDKPAIRRGDTFRYLGDSRVVGLTGDTSGMTFGLLITAPLERVP